MNFLLNIERRGVNNEIAPVLFIFAAPNKLRIEISVTRVADGLGIFLRVFDDRLMLGGGDV